MNIELLLNELIDRLNLKIEKIDKMIKNEEKMITKMNTYSSYDEEEDEEEKRGFDFDETFERRGRSEIIRLK